MDGLIPMVFKSLKRSKTRRQYQYLSSPPPAPHTYNIADFYTTENDQHRVNPAPGKVSGLREVPHRRCNSVHVDAAPRGFGSPAKSKQLVRFRSHRIFSCVTGA